MVRAKLARRIFAIAIAGIVLTGCSSVVVFPTIASETPQPSIRPSVGHDTKPRTTAEPFAGALAVLDEGAELLHQAIEREIVSCMKSKGFKYSPAPYIPREQHSQGRIGDLEYAAKEGVGIDYLEKPPPQMTQGDSDMEGLSAVEQEEYRKTLFGFGPSGIAPGDEVKIPTLNGTGEMTISKSGCRADAIRIVNGDFESWFIENQRLDEMIQTVIFGLENDERFQSARSI